MPRCRRSCLTFWTSCPRRGGYQPPAGACYAPLQMPGWGLAAAWHTGAAPLSGGAAPSYFLPLSWGTPERDRPSHRPASRRGGYQPPYGRMLCAPTNAGVGTGGGTAHRYRTLIRQGGPVLFSSPFVGNAGTGPALSADPHPAGAAVSRPRAHAMRPYECGVGTGGGTVHRHRPFPFRKIRRTTFPNAVRRLIRLPSALHGAGHCKNSSCTAGF